MMSFMKRGRCVACQLHCPRCVMSDYAQMVSDDDDDDYAQSRDLITHPLLATSWNLLVVMMVMIMTMIMMMMVIMILKLYWYWCWLKLLWMS